MLHWSIDHVWFATSISAHSTDRAYLSNSRSSRRMEYSHLCPRRVYTIEHHCRDIPSLSGKQRLSRQRCSRHEVSIEIRDLRLRLQSIGRDKSAIDYHCSATESSEWENDQRWPGSCTLVSLDTDEAHSRPLWYWWSRNWVSRKTFTIEYGRMRTGEIHANRSFQSLTTLNLFGNRIGPAGVKNLAQALRHNTVRPLDCLLDFVLTMHRRWPPWIYSIIASKTKVFNI